MHLILKLSLSTEAMSVHLFQWYDVTFVIENGGFLFFCPNLAKIKVDNAMLFSILKTSLVPQIPMSHATLLLRSGSFLLSTAVNGVGCLVFPLQEKLTAFAECARTWVRGLKTRATHILSLSLIFPVYKMGSISSFRLFPRIVLKFTWDLGYD